MPKERLIVSVCRRKLYYFGHLARESAGELGTSILEGKVAGKRSRGRPKATWEDNIKDWTGLSIHAAVLHVHAYDRQSGDVLQSWLPPTLCQRTEPDR